MNLSQHGTDHRTGLPSSAAGGGPSPARTRSTSIHHTEGDSRQGHQIRCLVLLLRHTHTHSIREEEEYLCRRRPAQAPLELASPVLQAGMGTADPSRLTYTRSTCVR